MEGGAVSMSSIDDRIVNMQFNNAQFQKGISQTNASLKELKGNLRLDGATDGIGKVQAAADRFSLGRMESALQNISSKFSAFGAVGFSVIQNLTNAALNAGKSMVGALVDPIVQGGEKRAAALQQANFQFRGLGLDIQATMNAALAAVKGTAFGLDDAALAAGQFGASGIVAGAGLETALRAVSGVAAQTGSSYESVAQIFEKVAGNGRLMGDDLLQLSSRGVNAAATLAKSMGTTESSVREMVTDGKISFQQFSDAMNDAFGANAAKANELYSGALSNMNAALARLGATVQGQRLFSLRDIFNALGPLIDNVTAALMPLINAFNAFQAASSATTVNAIDHWFGPGLVVSIQNIVQAILAIGKAIGGGFRQIFPDNTENQLKAIAVFLQNLTAALIPGTKAAGELQRSFAGFFALFDIAGQIIGSFIRMIAQLFGFIGDGSGDFLSITANIGDFIVKVDQVLKQGQFFTKFFQVIGSVLEVPIGILRTFVAVLASLAPFLSPSNWNTSGIDKFADDVKTRFSGLIQLGNIMNAFWAGVVAAATVAWGVIKVIFSYVGAAIKAAVGIISGVLNGLSFDDALQTVNTGLFAGLLVIIKKFTDVLKGVFEGNGGIVGAIKGVFGALTDQIKAMTAQTNAKTLTQIAIAIALLAASAVALSLVDTLKLAQALGAIAALMGSLIGVFAALQGIMGTKGTARLIAVAVTMDLIAGAILVLAGAVAILAALPFDRLSAAVGVIIVLLGALVGALWSLNSIGPRVIVGVAAISILAPAMVLLAGAIAILAAIPMDRLASAMGAMILALGAFIGTLWSITKIGPGVILATTAIAILAPAMVILATALAILGSVPLGNLAQALGAFIIVLGAMVGTLWSLSKIGPQVLIAAAAIAIISGALIGLVGAIAALAALPLANLAAGVGAFIIVMAALVGSLVILSGLDGPMIIAAVALAMVAGAINLVVGAVAVFAAMPMENLIQGIAALAIVLGILVVSVMILGGLAEFALAGAGALIIIAAALAIISPAIVLLGTMDWDSIGRMAATLGIAIAILSVGGVLLVPASVGFLLMGVALLLLGTGIKAAGEGIVALSVGIAALVVVGAGGLALMASAIDIFIQKLPLLGVGFGAAIVSMVVTIGAQAPSMITAFVNIILAMLSAINLVVPDIINTATLLIISFVNALVILIPFLADAGLQIIEGVLGAIAEHIGDIALLATEIVANFIDGIANGLPRIINSGINLIIKFINGLANGIRDNRSRMEAAGANLLDALTDGMTSGISNAVNRVVSAARRLAAAIPDAIAKVLHINSPSKVTMEQGQFVGDGVAIGMDNRVSNVDDSARNLGNTAIKGLKDSLSGVSDFVGDNLDMAPTIRPVIDLSAVKSGVASIPGLMPKAPSISLDTSNNVASSVSLQEQARNAQLVLETTKKEQPSGSTINFTQNNNSPKALSTSEVYRNTKNQLSTLKEDLGVVDQSRST
jgi:tape measure domain-containing protein